MRTLVIVSLALVSSVAPLATAAAADPSLQDDTHENTGPSAPQPPPEVLPSPAPPAEQVRPAPVMSSPVPVGPLRPQAPPQDRPEPTKRPGYQTLMLATDIGIMVGGALTTGPLGDGAGVAWIGSYLLVPPAIHAAHQNYGAIAPSILLRLAGPSLGAFIGYNIDRGNCREHEWFCGWDGAAAGIMVGYLTGAFVDDLVLAREREIAPPAPRGLALRGGGVVPTQGGATLTLAGTF